MRDAIRIKVERDLPWSECASIAGISEAGIHKARLRPAVQELERAEKLSYIQRIDAGKPVRRARALEHAEYLLKHSKSEAVQARMVEFLAGEPSKGQQINVQVNNNAAAGYEYVRPGQVVEIIEAKAMPPDSQSDAQSGQGTDNIEE